MRGFLWDKGSSGRWTNVECSYLITCTNVQARMHRHTYFKVCFLTSPTCLLSGPLPLTHIGGQTWLLQQFLAAEEDTTPPKWPRHPNSLWLNHFDHWRQIRHYTCICFNSAPQWVKKTAHHHFCLIYHQITALCRYHQQVKSPLTVHLLHRNSK